MSTSGVEIDVTRLMERLRRNGGATADVGGNSLREALRLPRLSGARQLAERKSAWRLPELLEFHDEDFVNNAYLATLYRVPDRVGFEHYLSALRSGRLTKIEILGRLRYSIEGRRRGAHVHGLMPRFLKDSLLRLPAIGYVLSVVYLLWRLPRVAANIQVFEAWSNRLHREQSQQVNRALGVAEQHLNALGRASNSRSQRQLAELRAAVETLAHKDSVAALKAQLDEMSGMLERLSGPLLPPELYRSLEDRFRGSRQEVKDKLAIYLPILEALNEDIKGAKVLDVGCGRGEWLELLGEAGFAAQGLDMNAAMIACCRERGLDVLQADVTAHLQSLPGECLCCISGFHIVEHLATDRLVAFLTESHRVLRPGGVLICETPNPENVFVGACRFYYDPTHRNPLPPALAEFLVRSRGFERVEIRRVNSEIEDFETDDEAGADGSAQAFLRRHFYAAPDYGFVAFKAMQ